MNEKAQAAIETLLMLAAAVFIAALVGLYLKNVPKAGVENKLKNQTRAVIQNIGQL